LNNALVGTKLTKFQTSLTKTSCANPLGFTHTYTNNKNNNDNNGKSHVEDENTFP